MKYTEIKNKGLIVLTCRVRENKGLCPLMKPDRTFKVSLGQISHVY